MIVIFSQHAQDLLDEQLGIIASALCPEDAAKWFMKLEDRLSILETFPEAGRLSRFPDLAQNGIHTLAYGKFVAYYKILEETCLIVSIRRAAMDVQTLSAL